jgi:putative inorganic carbon (HCO3(-)) transporter
VRSLWQPFPLPFRLGWDSPSVRLGWLLLALAAGLAIAVLPLPYAGLILVGAVVLIATLVEPLIGLALTLLAGPFGALESVILGGTSFDSGQLLLALTLAAWLTRSVARREIRLPRPDRTVALTLGLFMAIGALSLLRAPSLSSGLKELVKWIQIALVAWFAADAAGRSSRTGWVVAAVLLSGLCQALIGLWQFGLRSHGPEHFELVIGFRGRVLEAYRAYGTFEQPNPYGGFLGLLLPLALGWGVGQGAHWLSRRRPRSFPPSLLLPWLTAGLLGAALLASWSRGAWLGAAAAVAAMLLYLPRRRGVGVLLVLALLAAGWAALQSGLLPGSIVGRLTGFADYVQFQDVRGVDITPANYAVLERMAHWQAALNMADQHPWLGVGLGNYEAAYADYALLNWPYPLGHAHNIYLNLLAETGVLGLMAYLAFWAAVIALTARVIRRGPYPQRGLALGLMGAWVHLSVHHLVDKLYVNNIYLHLGALLGLLLLLQDQAGSGIPQTSERIGKNSC